MIERPFWRRRLEAAWSEAPIAWLSGVRRSGKTTLAESLGADRALFLDCDLPSVEDRLRDPELFFRSCDREVIVFDEVHQLRDPTRILKIAADRFPRLKILATGSSTLAASRKFRDSLTGRKRMVHLLPVLLDELPAFGVTLPKRLHAGGLPQALLADEKRPSLYREWIDSFFARDLQRLFGLRDIDRFTSLFEILLRLSGGQLDLTKIARAAGITRPTVESHLRALGITHAIALVPPHHAGGLSEIVKQPKLYAFDTGMVSWARGWDPLRPEEQGLLWEHVVLEHLQAHHPDDRIRYWRDKRGNEVDFVLQARRDAVHAIECKWHPDAFDATGLKRFRALHPQGRNYLVTPSGAPAYNRRFGDLEVLVCSPSELRGLTSRLGTA